MTFAELDKVFDVLVLFSPLLLVISFIMMSIFNHDLKALILVMGLLSTDYFGKSILVHSYLNPSESHRAICTMFNTFNYPASSIIITSFVFIYLLAPMIHNNNYNPIMLSSLAIVYSLEVYYKYTRYKCYNATTIITSTLIGLLGGLFCFYAIYSLGESYYNLLYFNVSQSNRVQCNRATEVIYQCETVSAAEAGAVG